MPDHFHALISVENEMSVERAVQLIKGGFAFRAGRELGFRAPVWERGFSEVRVSNAESYAQISRIHRRKSYEAPPGDGCGRVSLWFRVSGI